MENLDQARLDARSPSRSADAIGVALHPLGIVVGLLLLVGIRSAPSIAAGLGWASLARCSAPESPTACSG